VSAAPTVALQQAAPVAIQHTPAIAPAWRATRVHSIQIDVLRINAIPLCCRPRAVMLLPVLVANPVGVCFISRHFM
jgi:hypothetical protein